MQNLSNKKVLAAHTCPGDMGICEKTWPFFSVQHNFQRETGSFIPRKIFRFLLLKVPFLFIFMSDHFPLTGWRIPPHVQVHPPPKILSISKYFKINLSYHHDENVIFTLGLINYLIKGTGSWFSTSAHS